MAEGLGEVAQELAADRVDLFREQADIVDEPGGEFEYTSYCPLRTAVGTMQGCYQMVTTGGEHFDAEIAPFTLAVPHALN